MEESYGRVSVAKVKPGTIAFVLPLFNKFAYGRRAALTFLKYTQAPTHVIAVDDASPYYGKQDWVAWRAPAQHADGSDDGVGIPEDQLTFKHFGENGGLTRSWNFGLRIARDIGAEYVICGNSDVLFTPGWEDGLIHQLNSGYHLVAPVTNAPGPTNHGKQQVANYYPGYRVQDNPEYLARVADYLKQHCPPNVVVNTPVNGFFMMAKTETWWLGKYTDEHVFNPKNKMTKNEDELQGRWRKRGFKTGFVPNSFIFHYRAVSRGDRYKHHGWYRIDDIKKPI